MRHRWYPVIIPVCLIVAGSQALSQGYGGTLTMHGVEHTLFQSAASRGAGGTTIGIVNDVGLMFRHPASLQSLQGLQVSLGSQQQFSRAEQIQHYAPLEYYSNFSLLMESLTHLIPDPDTSFVGTNPGDTVQRPFDDIGPNWSRRKDRALPLQGMLAVPLSFGDMRFVAGIGAVTYADLNHHYQNNNVLSPSILSQRPVPISRPPNDSLPVRAQWSQYSRLRDGSIRGYGVAVSGEIPGLNIAVGVSGMLLRGSAEDLEQRTGRGRLTFFTNYFRLNSLYRHERINGSSDFKGEEFTVSGIHRGQYLSLGFSVRPPTTITRTFTSEHHVDTTGTPVVTMTSGEDRIRLPWRGLFGVSLLPIETLTLGVEYEVLALESSVYRDATGGETKPWLSAPVLRVGAEFRPEQWLALRAGIRGVAEVFEPEGNPLIGDPVTYSVYSAGIGVTYAGVRLNITYEYSQMKYQDVWGGAISFNTDTRHTIVADVRYELPWTWQ